MYTITPHFRVSKLTYNNYSTFRAALTTQQPQQSTLSSPNLVLKPIQIEPVNTAVEDPTSLRSTWPHRAWVTAGFATVLTTLAKSVITTIDSGSSIVEPLVAAYIGYVLADLGSGVYHWAIDNYGSASTPVFGSQIEGFQGHHKWPWTITRREFANNLYALARAVTFTVVPIELSISFFGNSGSAALHAFLGTCSGCIMLSQQFHAWAHENRRRLPPLVVALQDVGVLVPTRMHTAHHKPPYNNNYCIVSGAWNGFLDEFKVFEVMEMVIFFRFGIWPRSWSEPGMEWSEDGEDMKD